MNAQLSGGSRGTTYDWIQIITTNVPLTGAQLGTVISTGGGITTSFDNAAATSQPFYNGGGSGINATGAWSSDAPTRYINSFPLEWTADMYLVSYSGTSVTVLAGFSWGFE